MHASLIIIYLLTTNLNSWHNKVYGYLLPNKVEHRFVVEHNVGNSNPCQMNQSETDLSAGFPKAIFTTCRCKYETKQCENEVRWEPPPPGMHPVVDYRLAFFTDGIVELAKCFKIHRDQRYFIFNEENGFETGQYYTFLLTAEPILGLLDQLRKEMNCPVDLLILNDLPNVYINTSGSNVFNCSFTGYPAPDEFTWKFTPDLQNFINHTILHNNEHIKITKDNSSTTLTVSRATKAHEGRYTCYIRNYFGSEVSSHGDLHVLEHHLNPGVKVLGLIIGAVASGLLLSAAIFVIFKYYIPRKTAVVCEKNVYISYCARDDTKKNLLLKMLSCIQVHLSGITVIAALIQQNEINALGIAQWVTREITNADKIIVILSQEYLETLKSEHEDNTSLRIRFECYFIHSMIHQMIDKLLIISDGVKTENFPEIFQQRNCYSFPKDTSKIEQNNDFINMLAVLSGEDLV